MSNQTLPTILIVTEWHAPLGEVEVFTLGLIKELVTSYQFVLAVRLHNPGELPVLPSENCILHHFTSSRDLKRLINRYEPSLVHFQQSTQLAIKISHVGRYVRTPLLMTLHYAPSLPLTPSSPFKPHSWKYLRSLNKFVPLIATTPIVHDAATSSGVMMSGEIISVGVDTSRYQHGMTREARRALDLPEDIPLILFSGHPSDPQLAALVFQLSALAATKDICLITVGHPSESSLAPTLSQLKTRGRYHNLPELDRSDERHPFIYQAVDLAVLPSEQPGNSLPILEAMASGLRIIAPNQVEEALTELTNSPRLHLALGAANRELALKLDIAHTAAAYHGIYRDLLTEGL
ncbi:glycosyltransferase family 4 protein [Candidatus Saccharibacteria bacterium]|nr:glycosyltransferase family 4 protein [Candidatus Saccharibacteria bacterium]